MAISQQDQDLVEDLQDLKDNQAFQAVMEVLEKLVSHHQRDLEQVAAQAEFRYLQGCLKGCKSGLNARSDLIRQLKNTRGKNDSTAK